MAFQSDGVALKGFGVTTVSGFYIVSVNETESGENVEIADEDGDIVTNISNFGKRIVGVIEAIPKSGTAIPSVGATFTYTSIQDGSVTGRIMNVERAGAQKDVNKCTITVHRYAGITPA